MGPIWQAQLGESLVMLIGPSWEPNLLPFWAPNLGPIRETRCMSPVKPIQWVMPLKLHWPLTAHVDSTKPLAWSQVTDCCKKTLPNYTKVRFGVGLQPLCPHLTYVHVALWGRHCWLADVPSSRNSVLLEILWLSLRYMCAFSFISIGILEISDDNVIDSDVMLYK